MTVRSVIPEHVPADGIQQWRLTGQAHRVSWRIAPLFNLHAIRSWAVSMDLAPRSTTNRVARCLITSLMVAGMRAFALIPIGNGASGQEAVSDAYTKGSLNVSSYTFRDLNRDGIYDVGDRPLAHISVVVTRPDGSSTGTLSNISGFANFTMSGTDTTADIPEPGSYRFVATVPDGWICTSGNLTQTRAFRILPGAPADIVTDDLSQPIGFAQSLVIRGRIKGTSAVEVLATSPVGTTERVSIDGSNMFQFPVSPGTWEIAVRDIASGTIAKRQVVINQAPVYLATIDPKASAALLVGAREEVQFDDLIQVIAVAEVPSGYEGLDWHNWVVTHNRTYEGEGYLNGTMSGEFVAYNGSGLPALITSMQPFDFEGGYLSGAWARADGEVLHLRAWRGEQLAYEDEMTLSSFGPVYFEAGYRDITKLEFATEHGWQFVADDLQFVLSDSQ